jgi:hypothetical protein
MTYEEFQQLARLFILGSLDAEEMERFHIARVCHGERAEAFLRECRDLAAALAVGLEPIPPAPETKARLMETIRDASRPKRRLAAIGLN